MAEWLGSRAMNQKVVGSIPKRAQMMLCPWARHFTLLSSGECPCTYCTSLWIRASAKWLNVNVQFGLFSEWIALSSTTYRLWNVQWLWFQGPVSKHNDSEHGWPLLRFSSPCLSPFSHPPYQCLCSSVSVNTLEHTQNFTCLPAQTFLELPSLSLGCHPSLLCY